MLCRASVVGCGSFFATGAPGVPGSGVVFTGGATNAGAAVGCGGSAVAARLGATALDVARSLTPAAALISVAGFAFAEGATAAGSPFLLPSAGAALLRTTKIGSRGGSSRNKS